MKYRIEILNEWPKQLMNDGSIKHASYINDSLTSMQRRLFVFEEGKIFEHTILCPVLSDLNDSSLVAVKTIDCNNFIIEKLEKWPDGTSPLNGFIPQQKFNRLEFGYFCMVDKSSVIPSHLEFNALIAHYRNHQKENKSRPLIKVIKLID